MIDYHIYIVDNSSPDGSGAQLGKHYENDKDVSVLCSKSNEGYSAGNNIGIKRAEIDGCRNIAIVNSDVELLNDAFSILVSSLDKDDSILMIGPSIIDNLGNEAQIPRKKLAFKTFVLDRHPFCDILRRGKSEDRYYSFSESGVTKFDGSVSGCCFLVKARDFKNIGYFDEKVFLYSEEDILAYKMSVISKKAAVNADAKVWHKANISTNKEGNAFVQFHRWTSVLYMLKNYAHISKRRQILIVLWNIVTWDALSIMSKSHRKMRKEFREKNWNILLRE